MSIVAFFFWSDLLTSFFFNFTIPYKLILEHTKKKRETIKAIDSTMGDSCDTIEGNLVGISVALWFMMSAMWIFILIKLVHGCRTYVNTDSVKSVFAGYERLNQMDSAMDPLHS